MSRFSGSALSVYRVKERRVEVFGFAFGGGFGGSLSLKP